MDGTDAITGVGAHRAVIHVMGDQCDESVVYIISRKINDIRAGARFTLWAEHSRLAKPEHVRRF